MCRDEFRRAYRMIREFGPSIIHLQLCDGCRHRLELAYQCNETRKRPSSTWAPTLRTWPSGCARPA
jgi:hypothetical protein